MKLQLQELCQDQRQLFDLLMEKEGLDRERLPIPPRDDRTTAPLSSAQQRLWRAGELAGDAPFGNVDMTVRVLGAFQSALARQSLLEIAQRHEILRTTFELLHGQVAQIVHPTSQFEFTEIDLRNSPPQSRRTEAIELVIEASRRSFDFAREPLLRASLIQVDDHEFLFSVVTHHLATDGWGLRVLLREFSTVYAALLENRRPLLPDLPIQFGDFASWEKSNLSRTTLEREFGYWSRQLAGAPRRLTGLPRRTTQGAPSFHSETQEISFSPELTRSLRALSQQESVTLYIVVLAGFNAFLSSCAKETDIIVGTTISNRGRPELEGIIGNFSNNLLLRTDCSGDPSFRELLRRTRDVALEAYAHPNLPLEELLKTLSAENGASSLPQFETTFMMRDSSIEHNLSIPDLDFQTVPLESGAATVDLKIDFAENRDRITGSIEYRTSIYDRASIVQLQRGYEAVLRLLASDPDAPLSTLLQKFHLSFADRTSAFETVALAADSPREYVKPRNSLELELVQIWQQVLGLQRIGTSDNFFDIGGHSLLAARLFEKIEQRTLRHLPLSLLVQAPTIGQFAGLLREKGWTPPWSSLVPLQPLGSRPPFYLVHGVGGNVLGFRTLARHIGADQPVIGIQSWGLDGQHAPHSTIEEMAAHYLAEIRARQPEPPYLLGGFSMGGLIAFEMAQQLHRAGATPAVLIALDTFLESKPLRELSRRSRTELCLRQMLFWRRRLQIHSAKFRQGTRQEQWQYLMKVKRTASRRLRSLVWQLRKPVRPDLPARLPDLLKEITEINNWAAVRYNPKPYPGRMTFFRAANPGIPGPYDNAENWALLCQQGVEVHEIPGDHLQIIQEPHVQMLAATLRECIDRAQ